MATATPKKTPEPVRVKGIYRHKSGEEVRAMIAQTEGNWFCRLPIAWTMHLHRICDGRGQFGLLMRIYAHSLGAPKREGRVISEWADGLTAGDYAKELHLNEQTVQDAIESGIERGLWERRSQNPKARGRAYYQLRLCTEKWAGIADPIAPKKLPAAAKTEEARAHKVNGVERVRPGQRLKLAPHMRYEFEDVQPTALENELTEAGTIVLDSAGLLRIEAATVKAPKAPASNDPPVENKGASEEVHPSPRGRNSRLTPKTIPLTLAALKETGLPFNGAFPGVLIKAVYEAVADSAGDAAKVTDALLARAIPENRFPKQETCGAFVSNVPAWVASHLDAKLEDPPRAGKCGNCGKSSAACRCSIGPRVVEPPPEENPRDVYRRAKAQQKGKL